MILEINFVWVGPFFQSWLGKGKQKQVAQRATIAQLRAIINLLGLFKCSRAANSTVSGPIWLKGLCALSRVFGPPLKPKTKSYFTAFSLECFIR